MVQSPRVISIVNTNRQTGRVQASGHSNNLPLAILQNDQFAINLFSRVPANNISGVHGIRLDLSLLEECSAENDIEMGLFGQVHSMRCPRATNGDGPRANTDIESNEA